jgi:cyclophilin family peptidyl-prolyl cis-trans isomerase
VSKLTIALFLNRFTVLCGCSLAVGCSRPGPSGHDAGADVAAAAQPPAAEIVTAIARAEDARSLRDLPEDAQRSRDPRVRRAVARALARILDVDDGPLLKALEDDDDEVVAWAAFGLGDSCKDRPDAHVRALVARLASLGAAAGERPYAVTLAPVPALLRALGRCGGTLSERTLDAWLRRGRPAPEAAAFALGDLASHGPLSAEATGALLDAAEAAPPLDAALYSLGRVGGERARELQAREVAAARGALRRVGPDRIFAVRLLAEARDKAVLPDLVHVLESDDFTPSERIEAAHGLGLGGSAGQAALAGALPTMISDRPLAGDRFQVIVAAVGAVSDEPSAELQPALWSVARLEHPRDAEAPLLRRLSQARCAAGAKLARGTWDADILANCDVADGEAGQRATLASLDRGALVKARRAAWLERLRSRHVRVREAALEMVPRHPELGDAALSAIATALGAAEPGVVATAASLIQVHPERVFVLAASERRAALDPASPPPTANPAREVEPSIAAALRAALARPWADDLVETRGALIDAGLAAGLPEGMQFARAACRDANATLRTRAARALAAAGEKDAVCPSLAPGPTAAEIGHAMAHPVRVLFDFDAGPLAVRFDPSLAPIAATRFVALARSGFFTGVVVHRVAPGFVVQFGDRGGDGYGGSGAPLRCETSPTAFGPLDVGVALAGRDTGSSQIFVTLERSPRLDGQYSWVGRAEGDWNAVAEGDVVRDVTIDDPR